VRIARERSISFEYSAAWEPPRPLERATQSAWRSHSDSIYVRGKMNLPSCGKEFFPHTVSRFFFAQ
jgi:hypothetical protein